ncbi:ribbon-helix-helix domain-containing protein [Paeniroseomonas aquatica]|uniref:Ribbon-helix-helix domain-containing protein n=1 Tax=Paeniroseomonas aquatica TaxID=373043 RepID=A0ABT8ACF5_9PROT|nr:ribbon-helix-helix domain-containing protein [Paeniroseomonas aquatica]MDN3567462.1 ribbon-helix-helix domain-containing protein [Paeniroseomonas aquatica]
MAEGGHLRKRSFQLAGHRTSVALEPEFWAVLEAVAARRAASLAGLVCEIDTARAAAGPPLASALRVFALAQRAAEAEVAAPPPQGQASR